MLNNIFRPELKEAFDQMKKAAAAKSSKQINVKGELVRVPYPFPSPADWRDNWIYFIMADRFNNPVKPPAGDWDKNYGFRQGGTINGIREQLDYIAELGAGAIWLTPLLKNSLPPEWEWNYHGYGAQDFLSIDGRFGSDGTSATAEKEFITLVEEAHARGIFVIMDIVLNHTARVFDYVFPGGTQGEFSDPALINGGTGQEQTIEWLDGAGNPHPEWKDDLPAADQVPADAAVWPADLQRKDFFRRRGNKINDTVRPDRGFVMGDFDTLRQLVVEYEASAGDQKLLKQQYGDFPVLNILIQIYRYFIARFDIDGFRIDTVKYVQPKMVEIFGNAMREFAMAAGKHNFFTFGEIWDSELTVQPFIGRHSTDGYGIDAALDFPLFGILPGVAKCMIAVEAIQKVFEDRKATEEDHLSSHGEAGKYFVSFLDNHDQNERFNHRGTPPEQVLAGLALLFSLQGIPCLYYGTEQGLQGVLDMQYSKEDTREALWGKPNAFDTGNTFYQHIRQLSDLRYSEPALLYGRLYFREVSGNGTDFGFPKGVGGVVAFSRILADREVLIVANTHTQQHFKGFVVMDVDTNRLEPAVQVAYSNTGTTGQGQIKIVPDAVFFTGNGNSRSETAALYIELAPMEVQVLVPV